MTDNEIVKALECHVKAIKCRKNTCIDCPLYNNTSDCFHVLAQYTLNLINRQKAEIFKFKKEVEHFQLKNSELFKLNNNIVEENGYKDAEIDRLQKENLTAL